MLKTTNNHQSPALSYNESDIEYSINLNPSISFTSNGSADMRIHYDQCPSESYSIKNAMPHSKKKMRNKGIVNTIGDINIGNCPLSVCHYAVIQISGLRSNKSKGTQCGVIHLKRNKVRIVKEGNEISTISNTQLDESTELKPVSINANAKQDQAKNQSDNEHSNDAGQTQNELSPMCIKSNYNMLNCSLPLNLSNIYQIPSTAPSHLEMIKESRGEKTKFKPMGIYGQLEEIGRFPMKEVKDTIKVTKRKYSIGAMLAHPSPSQHMVYNYTNNASPLRVPPSSTQSNFFKGAHGLRKVISGRKSTPVHKRLLKRRFTTAQTCAAIDWSNSILYYSVKNGEYEFNSRQDELYTEYDVEKLIEELKCSNDAIPLKGKISRTLSLLSKELCIPWKDEPALNMLITARQLFTARKDVVELLVLLSKRELLILKDIMFMINSTAIENKPLLVEKIAELKVLDQSILNQIEIIQINYSFFRQPFMLGSIEIKIMIPCEWADITRIMRDVHKTIIT